MLIKNIKHITTSKNSFVHGAPAQGKKPLAPLSCMPSYPIRRMKGSTKNVENKSFLF